MIDLANVYPTLPDKNLKIGDFDYFVSNHNIAVYKWMDNKPVYMISSLHSPNDTFQVKRKLKDGNTYYYGPLSKSAYKLQ